MATATKGDQFANYAIISVTESAANTLTFKKLETGISITEKVAWILSRVEYFVTPINSTQWAQADDGIDWGLSLSNAFTTPGLAENTIIDLNFVARKDFGTAASAILLHGPWVKDFSQLPGGGILVPPTPLYLFAKGATAAAAHTVVARIHYTTLQLAIDQYWELVESRRVLES